MSSTPPAVAPATLHLLLADRATMWARAQALEPGWLTQTELARLQAQPHPARREEFVACRYALRHLLAVARGQTAHYWRLEAPQGAAPRVDARHHGVDISASTHLSLSHSGIYLACAVASQPVGVDLEVKDVRPAKPNLLELAAMACTAEEMRQLHAVEPGPSRHRLFLHWWTLKEAYFKSSGGNVDLAAIHGVERRRWTQADGATLACARSWLGATAQGWDVRLSACVQEHGTFESCRLAVETAVQWRVASDWTVVAPKSSSQPPSPCAH